MVQKRDWFMDKGGLRGWFVQTKDWLMDKGGLDLWIEQGTDDVGNNTKKPQQKNFYCGFVVVPPACKLDTSCNCFPYQVRFLHPF